MRSRMARVSARVSVLVCALLASATGTATAGSAGTSTQIVAAQQDSLDSFGAVALTTIGLGVVGMVVGVLRRKKVEVQPENQRKT